MMRWNAGLSLIGIEPFELNAPGSVIVDSPSLHQENLEQERSSSSSLGSKVFDHLAIAIVSLSEQGFILEANRAADVILHQQDGISSARERLICTMGNANKELERLISEAVLAKDGGLEAPGGYMAIARPSDRRPYRVAVRPMYEPETPPIGRLARILVLIDDPEVKPLPRHNVLQKLYGVSSAQSYVFALILQGLKRGEIADRLGLSQNTIKTHEREIFQLLDVHSRSELLTLVLPNLGALCP